jgi:GTP-binding protein
MLIDRAEITIEAGHGGAGSVSFGLGKHSGPNGGTGGKGGDLYIRSTSDITLLNQFSREFDFKAEDGERGDKFNKTGKGGDDLELLVPVGTSIINKETGELIVELTKIDQKELICKGGIGGKGNFEFKNPKRTTPEFAQPGLAGEKYKVILSLKLIADYGLIGLPNAGKSSLLNELTAAKAKIANYPFTTLFPNIGAIGNKFIADIPGLIENASIGKGLGIGFLKHIEKVSVLLHCISVESSDILKDYEIVRNELGKYNNELLNKKEIILLTKSDLIDDKELAKKLKILEKKSDKVFSISIHNWEAIEKLKQLLK